MEKCSLCGGRIVNHRCVDCGMPYPEKPRYTLRSESVHTHQVNGEEVLHRVRTAAGKEPVYDCDSEDEQDRIDLEGARPHLHTPVRMVSGPRQDKRRGGWLVTLVILGLALLPMLFRLAERAIYSLADFGGHSSYAEASSLAEANAEDMTGRNPYEGLDWGLPTAGTLYDVVLEPGYYTIGLQIPAGVYTITPDEDSFLNLTHADSANDWYNTVTLSCWEEEEPDLVLTNVQLAAGGTLWVDGSGSLMLHSANAQLDTQAQPRENPAGESFALTAPSGGRAYYAVGDTIPAGVYDVSWSQGSGWLAWDAPFSGTGNVTGYGNDYGSTVYFHSLVLTDGDTLTLDADTGDDCTLWLTPSAEVYE